jgi:glucosamine--fructose-6-phosphate aminotransferase (isomerizing)
MNKNDERYTRFHLVREMMETASLLRSYDTDEICRIAADLESTRVLLSGEGSSRIFPAKNCISRSLQKSYSQSLFSESARQASEYDLDGYTVFVASNSGKTKECVELMRAIKKKKTDTQLIGLTVDPDSPVAQETDMAYLLRADKEQAVAATKTVAEQAFFYDSLFRFCNGEKALDTKHLGDRLEEVMTMSLDDKVIDVLAQAPLIYFAGRNDGIAEELTLKTNEICRIKSDFLEGTYAVHGIEEVMQPEEAVILIDPFAEEEEKFEQVLSNGLGMQVIAVAGRDTRFPTIRVPKSGELHPYLLLAAGWNLLVEIGLRRGIDPDKTERARKIGNEMTS